MLTIKILGSGCPNCKKVEALARQAAASLDVTADFQKITDYADIAAHGVLNTPGLIIDDKLVCSGRVPTESEIVTWIANALATA